MADRLLINGDEALAVLLSTIGIYLAFVVLLRVATRPVVLEPSARIGVLLRDSLFG